MYVKRKKKREDEFLEQFILRRINWYYLLRSPNLETKFLENE